MIKVAVFSSHQFEKKYLLQEADGKIELSFFEYQLNPDTARLAQGFDGVCVFVNDDCSIETIKILSAHGIKYLVTRSAGYNQIDLKAANDFGVRVANCPEYSPYAIAEHTIALIMALNRKIIQAHNRINDLNFSLDGLVGFDLHKKKVGVIGAGKIGKALVNILLGFGCEVLINDIETDEIIQKLPGVTYVALEQLLGESDIITLHLPLNQSSHHIINHTSIDKMKDGVMLINTSRGALIDTKAVIGALKAGKIGYLGLDVYEEEQGLFFEDHSNLNVLQDDIIARLMTFKNVLITSHQAFLTSNALENIASTMVNNFYSFNNGQNCENELKA